MHVPHTSLNESTETTEPRLIVKIIRADDLVACDKQTGKSDPLCVLRCGTEEYCTMVKRGTIAPKWNEEFVFGSIQSILDLIPNGFLELVLRDEDVVEHGEIVYSDMGQICIPLATLTTMKSNRCPPQWLR